MLRLIGIFSLEAITRDHRGKTKANLEAWMAWLYLLAAAVFEIGWIYSLKFTEGFTRFWPVVFYGCFGLGAVVFLSLALRYYPVGITYAVWVGIAAAGSNIVGILFFGEPYRFVRILFIVMIIGGVVGLRFSSVK